MERGGSILVNNDSFCLSIPSSWQQEPTICHFLGIIIHSGVYEAFPCIKKLS